MISSPHRGLKPSALLATASPDSVNDPCDLWRLRGLAAGEEETRPGLVDGTDLVVHEALSEPEGAHLRLGQIRADPGGPLGPGDPQPSPFGKAASRCREAPLHLGFRFGEQEDDVRGALSPTTKPDVLRQRLEYLFEALWCPEKGDDCVGLDPQLLGETPGNIPGSHARTNPL